jgi:hypothetical protein
MRHVAMQPTETTSDVTCDACCQSTSIETALQSLERQLVSLRANCNDGREVEACGILAGISEDACIK